MSVNHHAVGSVERLTIGAQRPGSVLIERLNMNPKNHNEWYRHYAFEWARLFNLLSPEEQSMVLASPGGEEAADLAAKAWVEADHREMAAGRAGEA